MQFESMKDHFSPCVGSGMCCKRSACAFGHWDPELGQCKHLVTGFHGIEVTVYRCGIHDEVTRNPGAEWNPAFGTGCCSSLFNADRRAIIQVLRDPDHVDNSGVAALLGDVRSK